MNLQEYQQLALRTEGIVTQLEFNKDLIFPLLRLFAASAQALDTVKKAVYYRKTAKMDTQLVPLLQVMELYLGNALRAFEDRNKHEAIDVNPRVFHGIIGMATEAGELVEALISKLELGREIDPVNVQEEMADSSWYMAILHECLGLNWEEGLERNIAKLRKRYPEKFSEELADNRDLAKERAALEGKQV